MPVPRGQSLRNRSSVAKRNGPPCAYYFQVVWVFVLFQDEVRLHF